MKNRNLLSLISRRAKNTRDCESIPLHQARAKIAAAAGFRDQHDLRSVFKSNPDDYRLLRAALGLPKLDDFVDEQEDLLTDINDLVEVHVSEAIAGWNALDCGVESIEARSLKYELRDRILILRASVEYAGEQDLNRPFSATKLFLDVEVRLREEDNKWRVAFSASNDPEDFVEDDGFTVLASKTDAELYNEAENYGAML
jgi:hypothetical protein